jgi:hypothetical protein
MIGGLMVTKRLTLGGQAAPAEISIKGDLKVPKVTSKMASPGRQVQAVVGLRL